MYKENTGQSGQAPSEPRPGERLEAEYAALVGDFVRRFIYGADRLMPEEIEKVNQARRIPVYRAIEARERRLESLYLLLRGIAAHEFANRIMTGAWQAALVRQTARSVGELKPPESLTRQEVAEIFAGFAFRGQLVESEELALESYAELLDIGFETVLQVTDRISLQRSDIEILVNDLRNRQAEREMDREKRRAELAALDRSLAESILRIPEEQAGKRAEMQEIYMLRRLIHAADTGHLVSVEHGTPRADLRPDRGSVDTEIAIAGRVIRLQLKSFQSGARAEARDVQVAAIARAARKLEGSDTTLVVLDSAAVRRAYDSSLSRDAAGEVRRLDKLAALKPIVDVLGERSLSLVKLLGLGEQDLRDELAELARKQQERLALEEELDRKREEAAAHVAEAEAAREAERRRLADEAEERERQQAERQRQASAEAQAQREAMAAAKLQRRAAKQHERSADRQEREAREAAAREAEEREKAKALKAEERRRKREAAKNEAGDWPPESFLGLCTADVLKGLGLLPADWAGDATALLAAKKRFLAAFAKPDRNGQVTDKSKPDKAKLTEVFPTRQSFTAPTPGDVERLKGYL